jgi:pyruvate formate lyase activating enzyme
MDQEAKQDVKSRGQAALPASASEPGTTRRQLLKYGVLGLAGASAAGAAGWWAVRTARSVVPTAVFPGDAPQGELWALWQERGWTREAKHYLKLGSNVQCKLCPNECLLEPEDRSHCRTRVNKGGTLYTLAYGDPCAVHYDPIEKKPLFHFLPRTGALSIATAGCVFRCLNCQNWDISQKKPEETKDPLANPIRPKDSDPQRYFEVASRVLTMPPEDVVARAEYLREHDDPTAIPVLCSSIAYTYTEPTAWYEYMLDTAMLARRKNIKNVWITCGSMQQEPLAELCRVLDAANVDLKSFSEETYQKLNSGRLQPILDTLKTLKREGVWIEVGTLIVPGYSDDVQMIRRMCEWLVGNLGPDYPLHLLRFVPKHRLDHLPPTPARTLLAARDIARECGLHYVYLGNAPEVRDAETTFCPSCHKAVIEREGFQVRTVSLRDGRCGSCGTAIAGVWKQA